MARYKRFPLCLHLLTAGSGSIAGGRSGNLAGGGFAAGELLQVLWSSAVLWDSRRVDPLSQGALLGMALAIGEVTQEKGRPLEMASAIGEVTKEKGTCSFA